jgi:hypothetical protein
MNYIFHSTSKENIIDSLKSGILYANKYIEPIKRKISQTEELPYIYTLLYIPNISYNFLSYGFIFHPKILELEPVIFNHGWITHPNSKSIYIQSDDNQNIKIQKIQKIINYVKQTTKMTEQEILFIAYIILKDYLIGIMCPNCDKTSIKIIKQLLNKHNMGHVVIYTNDQMPYIMGLED